MNSKDYRNIREAYLNVYEQEEVLMRLLVVKDILDIKQDQETLAQCNLDIPQIVPKEQ